MSDALRVLIVDDEPLARRGIALRLGRFADIEIVGECGDGKAAVEAILNLTPDLVFLDIEMPVMNGFDVLGALPAERVPAIIFLTAYEQHAVRAFEVHALDYLLKPVDDERFAASIRSARRLLDSATQMQIAARILGMLGERPKQYASHFAVRTGSRIQIVLVEEIEWIAASGDYTELHVRGRSHLLREAMNSLERKLDPVTFLRIHRSRIVQVRCITELRSIDNGEYSVTLSDGSEHRSSRTYAKRLDSWLNGFQRG
ncbi:MAG TPA: LytTR family DNA-binding domain-containing protein [Candidatus Sulfotelmatobacter sp.]|nr:LytTR family DNA-binding domain-containing protein [Candidatus Sulfotelmatobacter sp.]